jgi:hypothetical protein
VGLATFVCAKEYIGCYSVVFERKFAVLRFH